MVGVIELSIRFAGMMALASPPTKPYIFGEPGFTEKSSISLFNKKPAPLTTTVEPYDPFNVVVTETAFPALSTIEKCVVSSCSATLNIPALISLLGVARAQLKPDILSFI
ncbi:hypothetical protein D3C72_2131570 [compost metagenome]